MTEESEDLVFVHGDGEVFNCNFASGVNFTEVIDLETIAFLLEVQHALRYWLKVLCIRSVLFKITYQ